MNHSIFFLFNRQTNRQTKNKIAATQATSQLTRSWIGFAVLALLVSWNQTVFAAENAVSSTASASSQDQANTKNKDKDKDKTNKTASSKKENQTNHLAPSIRPSSVLLQDKKSKNIANYQEFTKANAIKANLPQSADFIVAVVNSEPITNNEVRNKTIRALQQLAQQGATESQMPPVLDVARQVLDRLITEKAQLQLAQEMGLKIDSSTIDQAEQSVARQNQLSVSDLRRQLAAENLSFEQFRDDLRRQLLLERLREREVEMRVKVSELEIDNFLQAQQAEQSSKTSNAPVQEINIAQLLVAVSENATPEEIARLKAKADKLAQQARESNVDFANLVRMHSDASTTEKNAGGEMGLRSPDRYPPLFVESVQNLKLNQITPVLRSGAGFHILKLLDKHQGDNSLMVTQSHARHILLRLSPQLTQTQAIARLSDYRRRIEAGQATFADLAKEHSEDASGKTGGDLGWVSSGMFVPEFENVMNQLQPKQLSEPIVSRFGVHLIELLERRSVPLTQKEQREMARVQLYEKKLAQAVATWEQDIRGRAYVELREAPQ